jgi:hypothetical protein
MCGTHYVGLSFYLVSFIVIRRKFCCSLSVATRVQHSERATHASVYCRCPTALNVLSHVVISLCCTIWSLLWQHWLTITRLGYHSIAVGRETFSPGRRKRSPSHIIPAAIDTSARHSTWKYTAPFGSCASSKRSGSSSVDFVSHRGRVLSLSNLQTQVFAECLVGLSHSADLVHPNCYRACVVHGGLPTLQGRLAKGLYKILPNNRIGSGVMESITELPDKANPVAQHSPTLNDTMTPKAPTSSPNASRRKGSTKTAPPFSMKRAASSPNVRSMAGTEALAVSMAEKRRNKLGYHRTSVACGQSALKRGHPGTYRLTMR